jgi:adenylyltransferase/sulfurtransferase
MSLTKDQIARYSRQLILPQLGIQGQERLLRSAVLVIGARGLGSPAALYLTAAGVGTIGLVDDEAVEVNNLHRQILHGAGDVGRAKTESGRARLQALNPEVVVRAHCARFSALNAEALVRAYDVVVDGSDNVSTRYLANDACVLAGRPLVHGGVVHLRGQVMVIAPKRSACLRCVFPEPPGRGEIPSCQEAGILGSAAGVIGSLMAHEALKMLAGIGSALTDRLIVFDGEPSRFREVAVRRDTSCAVCGESPSIREATEVTTTCHESSEVREQKTEVRSSAI